MIKMLTVATLMSPFLPLALRSPHSPSTSSGAARSLPPVLWPRLVLPSAPVSPLICTRCPSPCLYSSTPAPCAPVLPVLANDPVPQCAHLLDLSAVAPPEASLTDTTGSNAPQRQPYIFWVVFQAIIILQLDISPMMAGSTHIAYQICQFYQQMHLDHHSLARPP